jgi:hypothetical protein
MSKIRLFLTVVVLVALALPGHLAAASTVTFTLTIKSAFLRSGPSLSAPRIYSIFRGQSFGVLGRNADGSWLRLDFPSEAWIVTSFGAVKGDVNSLPVLASTGIDAPAPTTPANVSNTAPGGAGKVFFKVTIKSTYVRNAPSLSGQRVFSIFKGQSYRVRAKNADGSWLMIELPSLPTETWVVASYGSVSGDLSEVPISNGVAVSTAPAGPTPTAPVAVVPAGVIPSASSRMRDVYQRGLGLGNNPRAFSKIGDCNSVNPFFLTPFDNPRDYQLSGPYASLQETIATFAGSFSRGSLAAFDGFSAATILDSNWTNRRVCQAGESPLACEYRIHRPSIAIISLGTNSVWQTDADYEASLRRIIEFSLDRGVVPILSTKADDLEGGGRFNQIVARLASEYDLPLWNFQLAVQGLPNFGLKADNFHLTWGAQVFTRPEDLQTGWQFRNLTALQALDAVWRAVR